MTTTLSNEAVRAFAIEAAFGARDPLRAIIDIGLRADSAADCHRKLTYFTREFVRFAHRALRAETRRLLKDVRKELD